MEEIIGNWCRDVVDCISTPLSVILKVLILLVLIFEIIDTLNEIRK